MSQPLKPHQIHTRRLQKGYKSDHKVSNRPPRSHQNDTKHERELTGASFLAAVAAGFLAGVALAFVGVAGLFRCWLREIHPFTAREGAGSRSS